MIAALMVYRKERKISDLLKQIFDYPKIEKREWYVPIILLMPFIAFLSYLSSDFMKINLQDTHFSVVQILLFFLLYLLGAIGEETGWSGVATEPLQSKYGALKASFILGFVWAIWHLIPYTLMSKTITWIFWQSISTILLRVIIVWLLNNTNKSIFAAILFHTMINISPYLIPNLGVNYHPVILTISLIITSTLILIFYRTNTFERKQRTVKL